MDNIVFWRLCNEFFVYDFNNIFIYFLSIIYVFVDDKRGEKKYEFYSKKGRNVINNICKHSGGEM
jgi:hypothetical protein